MSEPSEPSTEPTAELSYNVRWMTKTFNSRSAVESLLGPQRAAGVVSSHDYDAAMSFLPGFHRFYGLIFTSLALSSVYVFRKPSWSQLRLLGLVGSTAIGSTVLGNAYVVKSHFDFVRSLDNPGGFSRAVDHIQKQSGLSLPSSPIIVRKYNTEEDLHGNIENSQEFASLDPTAETSPDCQSTQTQNSSPGTEARPSSRWDQIRTANATTTASSSWDALRQQHEKTHVQRHNTHADQHTNTQTDDRITEQARFDALLEKERNIGS
ncbi:hypothetical protein Ac2012v2_000601 [Leucoagaricus gongylophorus]